MTDREKYAAFGEWCFNTFWRDGEPGDIDAVDAQVMAIMLGMLGRTSDHNAGATHAAGCGWQPGDPAVECGCFVPLVGPLR